MCVNPLIIYNFCGKENPSVSQITFMFVQTCTQHLQRESWYTAGTFCETPDSKVGVASSCISCHKIVIEG